LVELILAIQEKFKIGGKKFWWISTDIISARLLVLLGRNSALNVAHNIS